MGEKKILMAKKIYIAICKLAAAKFSRLEIAFPNAYAYLKGHLKGAQQRPFYARAKYFEHTCENPAF